MKLLKFDLNCNFCKVLFRHGLKFVRTAVNFYFIVSVDFFTKNRTFLNGDLSLNSMRHIKVHHFLIFLITNRLARKLIIFRKTHENADNGWSILRNANRWVASTWPTQVKTNFFNFWGFISLSFKTFTYRILLLMMLICSYYNWQVEA